MATKAEYFAALGDERTGVKVRRGTRAWSAWLDYTKAKLPSLHKYLLTNSPVLLASEYPPDYKPPFDHHNR